LALFGVFLYSQAKRMQAKPKAAWRVFFPLFNREKYTETLSSCKNVERHTITFDAA
jgi:hypothetical protein